MSDDPKAIAKRVVAWLATPEGQQSMRESNQRVEETMELFRSKLTWEEWHALIHRPFTI